jgi:23S rRNA (guanine745-N1)-methyltransferase
MSYLKCPVCQNELNKNGSSYVCKNNHSFDIAKKGYTNLMLANQGHSLIEGDKKDMVDARSSFLDSDKYDVLKLSLTNIIKSLSSSKTIFCDIACGEGYYTNYIHKTLSNEIDFTTIGIDISRFAINHACTRKNIDHLSKIDYFVGNMDYLPFLNNSFDILLNCFAPINEKEFYRVLKKDGYYIRVLPGVYHLYELKEFLYPEVHLNTPKVEELAGFNLFKEETVSNTITLNNEQIQNLFTMTPYYYKTSLEAKDRLKKLESLTTRIEFTIRIYQKQ